MTLVQTRPTSPSIFADKRDGPVLTTHSPITGHLVHHQILRRPTSLERLAMRLMARVMSPQRPASTRATALLLLVPAGIGAIVAKTAERILDTAGKMGLSSVMLALAAYLIFVVFPPDPALLEAGRAAARWLGEQLIQLGR